MDRRVGSVIALQPPAFPRPATRAEELAGKPGVVRFLDLPARAFVMIDGSGPPGDATFAPRMPGLYATAYALHFALKARGIVDRVGPLEGLWWTVDTTTDLDEIFSDDRWSGSWTLMIAIPSASTQVERVTAISTARRKLAPDIAPGLRIEQFDEGRVAQILHLGPYASERGSIERVHEAIEAAGFVPFGRHHEIYLGDPRRSRPERLRTIVRQPLIGRS